MENKSLHTTRQYDCTKELALSDETRTLIECRAKLGDILETISSVKQIVYGDEKEMIRDLEVAVENAFEDMDGALSDFISYHINRTMLDSVFHKV